MAALTSNQCMLISVAAANMAQPTGLPPVTRVGDIKHLLVGTEDGPFSEAERTSRRGRRNVPVLVALGIGLFICGFALGLWWAAP
jgi:hypothetical protein